MGATSSSGPPPQDTSTTAEGVLGRVKKWTRTRPQQGAAYALEEDPSDGQIARIIEAAAYAGVFQVNVRGRSLILDRDDCHVCYGFRSCAAAFETSNAVAFALVMAQGLATAAAYSVSFAQTMHEDRLPLSDSKWSLVAINCSHFPSAQGLSMIFRAAVDTKFPCHQLWLKGRRCNEYSSEVAKFLRSGVSVDSAEVECYTNECSRRAHDEFFQAVTDPSSAVHRIHGHVAFGGEKDPVEIRKLRRKMAVLCALREGAAEWLFRREADGRAGLRVMEFVRG